MNTLSSTWYCEGRIDFEMKQYQLLAYLQKVSKEFKDKRLYGTLSDLIVHYSNLWCFKKSSIDLDKSFEKELKRIDWGQNLLEYENKQLNPVEIEELKEIVEYGMEQIQTSIKEGHELYDDVARHMEFFDVGIVSIDKGKGALIVCYVDEFKVYEYKTSLYLQEGDNYIALNLKHINSFEKNLINNHKSIKMELIKSDPITYQNAFGLDFMDLSFPYTESVFPVIKREFIVYLNKNKVNI